MYEQESSGSSVSPSFSGEELAAELAGAQEANPDLDATVRADPRVQEIRTRVAEARAANDVAAERELVEENRRITALVKAEFEKRHNIYKDPEELTQEQERERLDAIARVQEQLTGRESNEELLAAFELIDEEGKPQANSPLFRAGTKRGFEKYISSIRKWKAAVESGSAIHNQMAANRRRTEMHDELATSVARDLGLEFDEARSLVAKIRDARIPNSGESKLYARSVLHELEQFNSDLGQFMEFEQHDLESALGQQRQPDRLER